MFHVKYHLADVIQVEDLNMGRLFWISGAGTISSHEPLEVEGFVQLEEERCGRRGSQQDSEHGEGSSIAGSEMEGPTCRD